MLSETTLKTIQSRASKLDVACARCHLQIENHMVALLLLNQPRVFMSGYFYLQNKEKMAEEMKDLAVALFKIEALKFGDFVTKVGLKTPVYFDLRVIISYPKLMHRVSKALWNLSEGTKVSQICGVPYTALPIATAISIDSDVPMLIRRKEAKSYGTKKLIEGKFEPGQSCVIIEDVVTSGSSILETVNDLRSEGLNVTQAFVVIDREQGGKKSLANHGIEMKNLFTLTQLMEYLKEAGAIDAKTVSDVKEYIKNCQAPIQAPPKAPAMNRLHMRFSERAESTLNSTSSKLFELMDSKQTTLCLAADLTESNAILKLADLAGPHIAVLKTHVDVITDFSDSFIQKLRALAKKYNFLLMEDRKFSDIGNTVALQYTKGVYRIGEWADLITAHSIAGPGIIDGIKKGAGRDIGIFLITEMSSKGALTTGSYVKESLAMADANDDVVVGHVCQSDIFPDAKFIQMTPGVQLSSSSDDLGQQYNTPEAVVKNGADLVVVGRGITAADDQLESVLEYKTQLWNAYKKRLNRQL